jgi:hypothetical protein
MKRWAEQWDATGVHKNPMKLTFNKTRHQYKDLGMWNVLFVFPLRMPHEPPDGRTYSR